MDIAKLTDGAKGIYMASMSDTVTVKGENVRKVVEPYYCKEKRIISAFCPHCGLEVNRVWNLEFCGSCGGKISWHDISVKDYGDLP